MESSESRSLLTPGLTYRSLRTPMEVRAASGGLVLDGYASTFDSPYDMGFYTERVRPGAFTRTLREDPDVRLLINHAGLPLARTKAGTLELMEDRKGLRMRAQLDPEDAEAVSVARKVERGDIDQMSFGFYVVRQEWRDDYSKRDLLELSLHDGDVSVVTYPANPATSVKVA